MEEHWYERLPIGQYEEAIITEISSQLKISRKEAEAKFKEIENPDIFTDSDCQGLGYCSVRLGHARKLARIGVHI